MQIVSYGDNLHEMSNSVFWGKLRKSISKCHLLKFIPRVLNVKEMKSVSSTIPLVQTKCANKDCTTDEKYGMHEDYQSYAECLMRQRNKGLFTADQVNTQLQIRGYP